MVNKQVIPKLLKHKTILSNFFSLSVLNGINIIFPLITLPYLVRVLGPDFYGKSTFAYSVMIYFVLFSNYGFNLTGTQKVSINRCNKIILSEFFSVILVIKGIITLTCFASLIILLEFVSPFKGEYKLYYYSFGFVIGNLLMPIWLFQGIEKMHFVTIINFVPRIIFTILIFFYIKKPEDYIYVNLFTSIGSVIGGVLSIVLSLTLLKVRFTLPSFIKIKRMLYDGWNNFVSMVSINFYRETNILLLGFLTDFTTVGIYSAAEKIIKAIQSLINPLSESLFPYFSSKFSIEKSIKNSITQLKKVSKYYLIVLSILSILIFLLAKPIVTIILGTQFLPSLINIRILSLIIVIGGMNYLFGIIGLINLGYSKHFMNSVLISGIISIIITIFGSLIYEDIAASVAMVISELVLFTLLQKKIQTLHNPSHR